MVRTLQHGIWMDEEKFKSTCIKEKGRTHQPLYGTWVADFKIRQIQEILWWKAFEWQKIMWRQRRCLGMAVAEITSTASRLTKISQVQSAGCHESVVQESARSPKREQWQSSGWNTLWNQQSQQAAKGWRNSYSCGPLHLDAPVWQPACCTKVKKQAQVCH